MYESYFKNDKNVIGRFFFIFGLTKDEFAEVFIEGEGIHVRKLPVIINQHLKKAGYDRVIFYSKTQRLFFNDDESYSLTKNPDGKSVDDDLLTLKTPIGGKIIEEPSSEDEKSFLSKKEMNNKLHLDGMNDLDSLRRIKHCMGQNNIKTAIVFTNADDFINYFGEVRTERGLEDIRSEVLNTLDFFEDLDHRNSNIVIFIFPPETLEKTLAKYEDHQSGALWTLFFKSKLENSTIIHISPPLIGEIRNAVIYYRSKGLKIRERELDEICNRIARVYYAEKKSLSEFLRKLYDLTLHGQELNIEQCDKMIGKKDDKTAEQRLNELIGMENVKREILSIQTQLKMSNEKKDKRFASRFSPPRLHDKKEYNLHCVLTGNPGTGKTTVANLLGELYFETGYLETGKTVKVTRADLVGEYIGQTAIKTRDQINKAMGGVLFIDEAYSLAQGGEKDYGREAIDTIVEAMTDRRGHFAVVVAGYPKEMTGFMDKNPGLLGRFEHYININDYKPEDLVKIFYKNITSKYYEIDDELKNIITHFFENLYAARDKNWDNARAVEKLVTAMERNWLMRGGERTEDDKPILRRCNIPEHQQIYCTLISKDKDTLTSPNKHKFTTTDALLLIKIETETGNADYASGFIITKDGYALTSHASINKAITINARLLIPGRPGNDISWYKAQIMNADNRNEIALIKLDGSNFPMLSFRKPEIKPTIGETIKLLTYYPLECKQDDANEKLSYSIYERKISSIQDKEGKEVMYDDMQSKQGSSGSPVLAKETDEVIGIICCSQIENGQSENDNYIIPVQYIWNEFINKTVM